MSATGQMPDGDSVRRIRRQVEHAIEQLGALSGSSLSPGEFYEELLRKGVDGIDAPAGAVWIKSPQGFLQQQCQYNIGKIGLDDRPNGRQAHNDLLRFAFDKAKPGILGPRQRADGDKTAGNPTDYSLALAPILNEDNTPLGIVEIFQKANWHPQDLVTYTIQVAGYASNYLRNNSNRKVANQEAVWTQIEVFSRQVHASLNPTEVAYIVSNEGRRLVGCDRISIGVRHSKKTTIEAVSGADVVEKSSTHIKRMRELFDAVITWGEKLVYRGNRDDTLPPKVLAALDAYLTEQNPKLLVLVPVRDEREKPKDKELAKPARSAILMEMFDPPELTGPLEQKLDVIAAHSAGALYNAAEMKAVPLKPLWWPIKQVQQGVGGKARFWLLFSAAALALIVLLLTVVPYPLKLDASGKLAPVERYFVFAPVDGQVREFKVRPGEEVPPGGPVAVLFKQEWAQEIVGLKNAIDGQNNQIIQLSKNIEGLSAADRENRERERLKAINERDRRSKELEIYQKVYNCDLERPGYYTVNAPTTPPSKASARPLYRVVTRDFKEELLNKPVRPGDPIMRLGHVDGDWEIVLKIPQKHIGQLLRGFAESKEDFLWVDILVSSMPTPGYQGKGKLYKKDVFTEAVPNRDDQNESEPVVYAIVRINRDDIPKEHHIDEKLLVTDVEVKTKIRCPEHSLGYSLFYGMWEFLYEKVIFFF